MKILFRFIVGDNLLANIDKDYDLHLLGLGQKLNLKLNQELKVQPKSSILSMARSSRMSFLSLTHRTKSERFTFLKNQKILNLPKKLRNLMSTLKKLLPKRTNLFLEKQLQKGS